MDPTQLETAITKLQADIGQVETAITKLQKTIDNILKNQQPQRFTHRDWILQAFEHTKTHSPREKLELAGSIVFVLCKKCPNMFDPVNGNDPEQINIVVLVDGDSDGFRMCVTVKEKLVIRGRMKGLRDLALQGLLEEVEERVNDV